MHVGALLTLEAAPLLDPAGSLRLAEIRRRLDRRLDGVPALRRRVVTAGPCGGRPLWIDDAAFDIANHVREVRVDDPATGEPQATAARLIGQLLDRSRPLWELWFITGFDPERCAVLVKIHHAIADGLAAIALMSALLDVAAGAPDPPPSGWRPGPPPHRRAVIADMALSKAASLQRAARSVRRLRRSAHTFAALTRELRAQMHATAPRTSINRPVGSGRRVGYVALDVDALKRAAHASGGTVNDAVLAVVAGGLRSLLEARGEHVSHLVASVPVSLRHADDRSAGNQVGLMIVPLPVAEPDARRRLELMIRATRLSKATQHPVLGQRFQGWMAAAPLAQLFMARQRVINVFATNVAGPPVPLFLLGARIIDLVPFVIPTGNVTLAFCACSYAGTLYLSVTADATSTPDIDVIQDGMAQTWRDLRAAQQEHDSPRTATLMPAPAAPPRWRPLSG